MIRRCLKPTILAAVVFLVGMPAFALCVVNHGVSLRAGAGSKFPVSWVVPKFMPLIEVQRVGDWYQVEDQDGELHWVSKKNVTSKMVCVSVKVSRVKLRTAANPQSPLAALRQVDRYTPFKRLDVDGEWYQVEASWGETYWVHESAMWRPVRVSKVNF